MIWLVVKTSSKGNRFGFLTLSCCVSSFQVVTFLNLFALFVNDMFEFICLVLPLLFNSHGFSRRRTCSVCFWLPCAFPLHLNDSLVCHCFFHLVHLCFCLLSHPAAESSERISPQPLSQASSFHYISRGERGARAVFLAGSTAAESSERMFRRFSHRSPLLVRVCFVSQVLRSSR